MADSLNVQLKAKYTPDDDSERLGSEVEGLNDTILQFTRTMTGTNIQSGTQVIGTSEEAVGVGSDLGTEYYIIVKNLDSTNFVELGSTSALGVKLLAKEVGAFRVNAALYAQADTASVNIQYWAFEK